jgi:predicted nucleic acid-binding protein
MPRYMLDTDTSSYVMKRSNDALLKRLRKTPVSDVRISAVTKTELLYESKFRPTSSGTRLHSELSSPTSRPSIFLIKRPIMQRSGPV